MNTEFSQILAMLHNDKKEFIAVGLPFDTPFLSVLGTPIAGAGDAEKISLMGTDPTVINNIR